MLQTNIKLLASDYRVIEVPNKPPAGAGKHCYALADKDQHVVWVWRKTPQSKRQAAIDAAIQLASGLVSLPLLCVG